MTITDLPVDSLAVLEAKIDLLVADAEARAHQREMLGELAGDLAGLSGGAMEMLTARLGEAERKGYLDSVREIFQPELLILLGRMVEAIRAEQAAVEMEREEPPSLWALARQLRDPDVRRGMGRALHTLRTVAVETGPRAGPPTGRQPTKGERT